MMKQVKWKVLIGCFICSTAILGLGITIGSWGVSITAILWTVAVGVIATIKIAVAEDL